MRFRFSRFVVSFVNYCESKWRKIHVVFVQRIDLFHYQVFFVRVK